MGSSTPTKGNGGAKKRVFVSFSSRDLDACKEIQERLRAEGIDSWAYPSSIPATEQWTAVIAKQLLQSQALLLLLSKDSNQSPEVRREVHLAAEGRLRIVIFRLDRCELDPSLRYNLAGVQRLNESTVDWHQELDVLVSAVRDALALEPLPRPAYPRLHAAWYRSKRFTYNAWKFSRTLSLAVVALMLLTLVLLWQLGILGKVWEDFTAVRPDLELRAHPNPATEGAPVQVSATATGRDGRGIQGKIKFTAADGSELATVDADSAGTAVLAPDLLAGLSAGEHAIRAELLPFGRYRSSKKDLHLTINKRQRPPPDPASYGVVAVSTGGVRALAVKGFEQGARWRCDRGTHREKSQPGAELDFDKDGNFTEKSIRKVLDGVEALRGWLEAEGVPADHIRIVVGSGIQGWSERSDCTKAFMDRLRARFGPNKPELLTAWEEAACSAVAVPVVLKDPIGSALVIDVDRDNVKAALVKAGADPFDAFPNRLEAIRTHIPGTRSLDRWALESRRRGRSESADALINRLLRHENTNLGFSQWEDVYVVGDDTWSLYRLTDPNGRRPTEETKAQLPAKKIKDLYTNPALAAGLTDARITPEMLSAAKILEAMHTTVGLGEFHPLTLVHRPWYDWLFAYLERRVSGDKHS